MNCEGYAIERYAILIMEAELFEISRNTLFPFNRM